jgi:hypothetical protein
MGTAEGNRGTPLPRPLSQPTALHPLARLEKVCKQSRSALRMISARRSRTNEIKIYQDHRSES